MIARSISKADVADEPAPAIDTSLSKIAKPWTCFPATSAQQSFWSPVSLYALSGAPSRRVKKLAPGFLIPAWYCFVLIPDSLHIATKAATTYLTRAWRLLFWASDHGKLLKWKVRPLVPSVSCYS